jgi:hypothetical protein
MPYADGSLAGYLSFGVVEHFREGPFVVLTEAFRVLRPGGVAIITTPAPGYARRLKAFRECTAHLRFAFGSLRRGNLRRGMRAARWALEDAAETVSGRTSTFLPSPRFLERGPFWQYEYRPRILARWIKRAGFRVVESRPADLRFNEYVLGRWRPDVPEDMERIKRLDRWERGSWLNWGKAFAVTIAIKPGPRMHCFLCGEPMVTAFGTTVPLCNDCRPLPLASYYQRAGLSDLSGHHYYEPGRAAKNERDGKQCTFCRVSFTENPPLGDPGFLDPVCPACLRKPSINIPLANDRLKLVWRPVA